jgi:hypothetical protein
VVLYMSTPSSPEIRAAMSAGEFGCMTTPAQGNIVPADAWYGCDNGMFGKGWVGFEAWFRWLMETVEKYGTERCLFAVAPDVPYDAAGTLAKSRPWLERIRSLGIPAAFAMQDGCELGWLPDWDEFDVMFLAGSTEWKISQAAMSLSWEAKDCGKHVHMGRVNSRKRLRIAETFGCNSADGTYFKKGPDKNLVRMSRWAAEIAASPSLWSEL